MTFNFKKSLIVRGDMQMKLQIEFLFLIGIGQLLRNDKDFKLGLLSVEFLVEYYLTKLSLKNRKLVKIQYNCFDNESKLINMKYKI